MMEERGLKPIKVDYNGLDIIGFFFTSMESHHENHLIYSDPDDNRMVLMENSPAKHI